MSENSGEGLTRDQILMKEFDDIAKNTALTDKEKDQALANIARDETQFHNEGTLSKTPKQAEVMTGANRREIHVAVDGTVLPTNADVTQLNTALKDNMRPGR